MKNIVVIGGGHGLSIIFKGIKNLKNANVTAIVTVADDGGSTGRIREYYNIPAMGDIRNVLVALSNGDPVINELMSYRFEGSDKKDIVGHSLGNLILTALTQMYGSMEKSIETVSDMLKVNGTVLPSSFEIITLYARMDDDTIVKGEANIPSFNHHINEVFYDHPVMANPKAVEAIMNADLVVYGVGSLYTSICANTIIDGIREALEKTKAKRVYFANCMTQNNETFDYDLKMHVEALKRHGAVIDEVIQHNDKIPEEILKKYRKTNSIEVVDNNNVKEKVIKRKLLDFKDGLIRHDPKKIKKVIMELLGD